MALKTVKIEESAPVGAAPGAGPAEAAPGKPKPPIKKLILPILGGVAALVAIFLVGSWFFEGRFLVKTDNAGIRSDITPIAPKVQGYVEVVAVNKNTEVKAGQLLLRLDQADFKARVAEAKAALAQAEANAAQSRARISAQSSRLVETRAGAVAADAQADQARSDAARLKDLADKGWYPRARLEQAETSQRTANAQREQANAAIRQAQQELAASASSAKSADAMVEAAKARLAAAELDLSRTELRAPMDGTVSNPMVTAGMLLSPGSIVMTIVPKGEAYVIANFKETQITDMKPGQKAKIHVDGFRGECEGVVDSIAQATGGTFSLIPQDTATGNFTKIVQRVPVKITLSRECLATGAMRTGVSAEATVDLRGPK